MSGGMLVSKPRMSAGLKSRSKISAIFILATIIFTVSQTPIPPRVYGQGSENLTLAVESAPPILPADGGQYSSIVVQIRNGTGFPVPAGSDVEVVLSSSESEVGSVDRSVTIRKGSTFAIARFTSTFTPGVTTITAAADGFSTGSGEVRTLPLSGKPVKLVVSLGPEQLLPELGSNGTVVVQLLDANGVLAEAPSDIPVSLTSSNPSVATVDPSLTIKSGSSYGVAHLYATFTPGVTTITASASGYATGSAVLTTKGPTPSKLAVYVTPPQIPERADAYSLVVVQLQDSNGAPARAPVDIPIRLTSSNTTVGFLDRPSIVIESGKTYATTRFMGSVMGVAQMTASAQMYGTGFATVKVVRPGMINKGRLAVYLAPPIVLPDNSTHRSVVVQLQDTEGNVARAERDVKVNLASSNINVGSVTPELTIEAGSTFKIANFSSTHAAGSTVITASATDFITSSATMTVAGAVPYRLVLSVVPSQLPADGEAHRSLVIQLQDAAGTPVKAPFDFTVMLSSSKTDVGTVEGTVTMMSGRSVAMAYFFSTPIAGVTTVTASASGYVSSSVDVRTVEPTPSNLKIYTAPSILPASGEDFPVIVVQLQDSAGTPARARSDIEISLVSSASDVGRVDGRVILSRGEAFVRAKFYATSRPGESMITALASGYAKSSSKITTVLYPLTINFSTTASSINLTETATVTLTVRSMGEPVSGAEVFWKTSSGRLLDESEATDTSGSASARLRPERPGEAVVSFNVSKIGYMKASGSFKIMVLPLHFSINITAESRVVQAAQPTYVNVTVYSGDTAVEGATLTWSTDLGVLSHVSETTGPDGGGSAVFFSNDAGSAEINVTVSKMGYVNKSASISIEVEPTPPPTVTPELNTTTTTTTTTTEGGFSILGFQINPLLLLGVGVTVGVVILVSMMMVIRRLRRGGGGMEELEGFVEEG